MTSEICLAVCLISFMLFYFRQSYAWAEERRFLLNREVAKSAGELSILQKASEPSHLIKTEKASKKERIPSLPFGL